MAKLSTLMVGMILVSLTTVIFGFYYSELGSGYNVNYDNSSLEVYNKLDEMKDLSEDIEDETSDIKENTGVLDVIGNFFSAAYDSLKLTLQSIDIFNTMADNVIEDAGLGKAANPIKTAIIAAFLIVVVVGIVIAVLVKAKQGGL